MDNCDIKTGIIRLACPNKIYTKGNPSGGIVNMNKLWTKPSHYGGFGNVRAAEEMNLKMKGSSYREICVNGQYKAREGIFMAR
jgi:hypothetical protein